MPPGQRPVWRMSQAVPPPGECRCSQARSRGRREEGHLHKALGGSPVALVRAFLLSLCSAAFPSGWESPPHPPALRRERLGFPRGPGVSVEAFLQQGEQAQLKNTIKRVGEQEAETQLGRDAAPAQGTPPHTHTRMKTGLLGGFLKHLEQ